MLGSEGPQSGHRGKSMKGLSLATLAVASVVAAMFATLSASADTTSKMPALKDDTTTAEFVRTCGVRVPSGTCVFDFLNMVSDNVEFGGAHICLPSDKSSPTSQREQFDAQSRSEIRNVVRWLKAHREFDSQSETAGIGAAASATYPCKRITNTDVQ